MDNRIYRTNFREYTRIDKRKARQLYTDGQTVYLLGVNCLIGFMYTPCPVNNEEGRTFDAHINEFEYYNCDYERGYYPAFYSAVDIPAT